MTDKKLLQQALDALEYYDGGLTGPTTASAVANLLRAAIEQPDCYHANCPCCGESEKCEEGCTFITDCPDGYEIMQEAREVLEKTK